MADVSARGGSATATGGPDPVVAGPGRGPDGVPAGGRLGTSCGAAGPEQATSGKVRDTPSRRSTLRVMKRTAWLVALLGFGLMSCGSKESVSLSATIEAVDLTVEQVALGTSLTGSFELVLELGSEASEPTDVQLEQFSLLSGSDGRELMPLQVTAPDVTFPVRVDKGQRRPIRLELADGDPGDTDRATLCGALQIRGAVTDSLSNGALTTASSGRFTAAGCGAM